MKRFLIVLAVVVTVGLLGCLELATIDSQSYTTEPSKNSEGTKVLTTVSVEDRIALDRQFPKDLILLNQQALELIDLELQRGQSSSMRQLASVLKESRLQEIEMAKGILDEWNEPYTNLQDFPQHGGHDMYPTVQGMASFEEMETFKNTDSSSIDKAFLTLMDRHIEGSANVAKQHEDLAGELTVELARTIIDTRKTDLSRLSGVQ